MREYINIINEAIQEQPEELICDHTSKNSIRAMVDKLYFITPEQRRHLAIFAIDHGLMTIPFSVRMTLKILSKNKRKALEILFNINPEISESIWEETLNHMLNGYDRYDIKSAGGFCKQELEQLFSEAHTIGFPKVQVI